MGLKIAFSGLVLASLLLLPGCLNSDRVPTWFKAVVLITGGIGMAMAFVGALISVWS